MQEHRAHNDNADFQQALAATLIANQGLKGAIRSCQEFGWDGVLHLLRGKDAGSDQAAVESRLCA